ncbi:hypothetical protein EVAR_91558_1 [Eumeta japonica]|uniref:Uncharacterized protein n=1 Tax=Eumeta variegata TaxID=151549 RepID=A0A4C1XD98_EUMVA|nr:hypothetical protein EVAR_91558_1 [Eumeta japonica]
MDTKPFVVNDAVITSGADVLNVLFKENLSPSRFASYKSTVTIPPQRPTRNTTNKRPSKIQDSYNGCSRLSALVLRRSVPDLCVYASYLRDPHTFTTTNQLLPRSGSAGEVGDQAAHNGAVHARQLFEGG